MLAVLLPSLNNLQDELTEAEGTAENGDTCRTRKVRGGKTFALTDEARMMCVHCVHVHITMRLRALEMGCSLREVRAGACSGLGSGECA